MTGLVTGLLARVSRWLVRREPLWLVTGAGALLDVATYVIPAVPDSWHPWVNGAVVVLGVVSGRSMVSPIKATGGTIPRGTPGPLAGHVTADPPPDQPQSTP